MAAAALVLVAASGCSQVEGGEANPAAPSDRPAGSSTQASPTTGGDGASLAPPVASPKDARGTAACDLLQPAQVEQLGLAASTRRELDPLAGGLLPGCGWDAPAVAWSVGYHVSEPGIGLDRTYQARASYQHFEPRDIAGHPAVDAQTVYDPEDCYTYVGLADDQELFVNVDNRGLLAGEPLPPACERLDEIVTMIIGNLPPLK